MDDPDVIMPLGRTPNMIFQAQCPACYQALKKEYTSELAELEKQYGTIPSEEFVKSRLEIKQKRPKDLRKRLRSRAIVGISAGCLMLRVKSACETCGYTFTHDADIEMVTDE